MISYKWIKFFLFLFIFGFGYSQNTRFKVGNNPTTIQSSALMEMESTDKGVLLPRLTKQQMYDIKNPTDGLFVFDTDSKCLRMYAGGWSGCFLTNPGLSLDCTNVVWSRNPHDNMNYNGSFSLPYTLGEAQTYTSLSISSTGVTGLTAVLPSGALAFGSGVLNFTVSGSLGPITGSASFPITIAGKSCTIVKAVTNRAYGAVEDFAKNNLGGIETINMDGSVPSTITAEMHGNYYLWGNSVPVANGTIQTGHGQGSAVSFSSVWLDNPCPVGWTLPNLGQITYLNSNSNFSTMGNWVDDLTNYSAAKVITSKSTQAKMVLPAQGVISNTEISSRGVGGTIWVENPGKAVLITFSSGTGLQSGSPVYTDIAGNIRCVKD